MENNICRKGCDKSFKSISSRNKHELSYCPIIKQINNQKTKDFDKLKIDYDLIIIKNNIIKDELHKIQEEYNDTKEELDKTKDQLNNIKNDYTQLLKDTLEMSIKSNDTNTLIVKSTIETNTTLAKSAAETNMKLVETNADMSNKSMSAMKYLTKYVTNVPILKTKKDVIAVCIEDATSKDSTTSDLIIEKYVSGKFVDWIGNMISNAYKCENLNVRAMYSTDSSRLTYIIGAIIKGTKKAQWVTDDGGIKVIEVVIKPILSMISDTIEPLTYINPKKNIYDMTEFEMNEIFNIRKNSFDLITEIRNGKLNQQILKIIASELHFKRFQPEFDKMHKTQYKQIKDDDLDSLSSDKSIKK